MKRNPNFRSVQTTWTLIIPNINRNRQIYKNLNISMNRQIVKIRNFSRKNLHQNILRFNDRKVNFSVMSSLLIHLVAEVYEAVHLEPFSGR